MGAIWIPWTQHGGVAIRFVGWVEKSARNLGPLIRSNFCPKYIHRRTMLFRNIFGFDIHITTTRMIIVSIWYSFYMFLPLVSHLFSFRNLLAIPAPFGFISLEGTGCGWWRQTAGEAQSGGRRWGVAGPQFVGDSKYKPFWKGIRNKMGSFDFLILRLRWGMNSFRFCHDLLRECQWFHKGKLRSRVYRAEGRCCKFLQFGWNFCSPLKQHFKRNHTLWQSNHIMCWVIVFLVFVSVNLYRIADASLSNLVPVSLQ